MWCQFQWIFFFLKWNVILGSFKSTMKMFGSFFQYNCFSKFRYHYVQKYFVGIHPLYVIKMQGMQHDRHFDYGWWKLKNYKSYRCLMIIYLPGQFDLTFLGLTESKQQLTTWLHDYRCILLALNMLMQRQGSHQLWMVLSWEILMVKKYVLHVTHFLLDHLISLVFLLYYSSITIHDKIG